MEQELNSLLSKPLEYYFRRFPAFDFNKHREVILFGAAKMGKINIDLFKKNKVRVLAIVDNDPIKVGEKIKGVPIIGIPRLLSYQKSTPIVITSIYDEEISKQLKNLGFNKVWSQMYFSTFYSKRFFNPPWVNPIDSILKHREDIMTSFSFYEDDYSRKTFMGILKYRLFLQRKFIDGIKRENSDQYFEKKIISFSPGEVFVDVGAYDGDTIKAFFVKTRGIFKKIYAFEPDGSSFKKLKKYVGDLHDNRIKTFKYGLGEKKSTVSFVNDGTVESKVSTKGTYKIKIVSLDELLPKEKVTYVKMDIEGSEMGALVGAKKIIMKNKPKLAICVYHKPADFWELPLFIKQMVPSYKLYLRHYTNSWSETVCYAL